VDADAEGDNDDDDGNDDVSGAGCVGTDGTGASADRHNQQQQRPAREVALELAHTLLRARYERVIRAEESAGERGIVIVEALYGPESLIAARAAATAALGNASGGGAEGDSQQGQQQQQQQQQQQHQGSQGQQMQHTAARAAPANVTIAVQCLVDAQHRVTMHAGVSKGDYPGFWRPQRRSPADRLQLLVRYTRGGGEVVQVVVGDRDELALG
jgi:hypothetical protein